MSESPLVNLSAPSHVTREALNTPLPAISEGPDGGLSGNLNLSTAVRTLLYLRRVPHGQRVAATRQAAFDLGISQRSLYRWRRRFWSFGVEGLRKKPHSRPAEQPKATTYTPEVAAIIRRRAPQIANVRGFWRALGCPASARTLGRWVRRYQRQAAEIKRKGEEIAASF
jgi:hypothetical protein